MVKNQGRDLGSHSRAPLLKHSAILPYVSQCEKQSWPGEGRKGSPQRPLSLLYASFQFNICSKFLTMEPHTPCIPLPSPHAGIMENSTWPKHPWKDCTLSLSWLPFLKLSHDFTIHYLGAVNSKQSKIPNTRNPRKETVTEYFLSSNRETMTILGTQCFERLALQWWRAEAGLGSKDLPWDTSKHTIYFIAFSWK